MAFSTVSWRIAHRRLLCCSAGRVSSSMATDGGVPATSRTRDRQNFREMNKTRIDASEGLRATLPEELVGQHTTRRVPRMEPSHGFVDARSTILKVTQAEPSHGFVGWRWLMVVRPSHRTTQLLRYNPYLSHPSSRVAPFGGHMVSRVWSPLPCTAWCPLPGFQLSCHKVFEK